jgi:hypothetical protein
MGAIEPVALAEKEQCHHHSVWQQTLVLGIGSVVRRVASGDVTCIRVGHGLRIESKRRHESDLDLA